MVLSGTGFFIFLAIPITIRNIGLIRDCEEAAHRLNNSDEFYEKYRLHFLEKKLYLKNLERYVNSFTTELQFDEHPEDGIR
jgi:hypothetical protein